MCGHSHNVCVTVSQVQSSVKSATKSCVMDPLPTWFLKNNVSIFLSLVIRIIIKSHSAGIFPLVKKPSMNPDELRNYRPAADKFLSKLIEKRHVVNNINVHQIALLNLGNKL